MKSRSEPSESDSNKRCNTMTHTCKTEYIFYYYRHLFITSIFNSQNLCTD
jgi:hypothetical protein